MDHAIHIIGGDDRDLYLHKFLKEKGFSTITLWGFDKVGYNAFSLEDLKRKLGKNPTVILPMSGTNELGLVKGKYSSESIVLGKDFFDILPDNTKIIIGYARKWFKEMCMKNQTNLIEVAEDDEIAILNSIPSAEGAIQIAMENSEITIHDSKSLIIGFGRCGITLARIVKNLDSKVYVMTRNKVSLARSYEMGFIPVDPNEYEKILPQVDFIYNTAPNMVLPKEKLKHCINTQVIVDIASAPGGVDFDYAKEIGIKAILAPGLPGLVAPKTAAKILAEVYPRFLRGDYK